MNEPKLLHVLQPGQELSCRFREATGQVLRNLRAMRLTADNGNPYACVYVTHVDETGVSLYITRGHGYGGDMNAFLPKDEVAWQAYFSPLDSFNHGYKTATHYERRFPIEFI
jgi:hypothetical protein